MKINISKPAKLPSKFGLFMMQSFKDKDKEHLVIFKKPWGDIPIVRVHSECLTGDALGSLKCDCGEQLQAALSLIENDGGMILYLRQEGRGIGLFNKINAYALQDEGLDTIEANHQLGFRDDERDYKIACFIFEYFGIDKIKLITNNPKKIESLGCIDIKERIVLPTKSNPYNKKYLEIKKDKMGHLIK